jgi:hypothetical protein
MDFTESINILNIDENIDINSNDFFKTVKQQYHKLALLYHPDKNPDDKTANDKFRKINEAYVFLQNHTQHADDEDSFQFSIKKYKTYLYDFLTTIYEKTPTRQKQKFVDLIEILINSCEKSIIPVLQKYKDNHILLYNVYQIIVKYKEIFHLSIEILNKIEEFVQTQLNSKQFVSPRCEREVNDELNCSTKIFTLTPRLKDLLEGNVYVFNTNNRKPIYIPLWALNTELYYDMNGDEDSKEELLFQCIYNNTTSYTSSTSPQISFINLDENTNDIYLNVSFEIKDVFNKDHVELVIDNVKININIEEIKLKKNQTITLFNCGIPIYNHDDAFNIDNRGKIIISLEIGV